MSETTDHVERALGFLVVAIAQGYADEIFVRGTLRSLECYLRDAALEDAAKLCERTRCRNWDASECARQIREQLIRDRRRA